jgi:hypothetical protein
MVSSSLILLLRDSMVDWSEEALAVAAAMVTPVLNTVSPSGSWYRLTICRWGRGE